MRDVAADTEDEDEHKSRDADVDDRSDVDEEQLQLPLREFAAFLLFAPFAGRPGLPEPPKPIQKSSDHSAGAPQLGGRVGSAPPFSGGVFHSDTLLAKDSIRLDAVLGRLSAATAAASFRLYNRHDPSRLMELLTEAALKSNGGVDEERGAYFADGKVLSSALAKMGIIRTTAAEGEHKSDSSVISAARLTPADWELVLNKWLQCLTLHGAQRIYVDDVARALCVNQDP